MKQSRYRGQENPKDQVRVILSSIEANVSNLQDYNFPENKRKEILARIADHLQDAKELITRYMQPGEWGEGEDTLRKRDARRGK